MTYQETISYLYNQLPMYSRVGASAYKKDLHNIIELCKALGDPQKNLRTIHVAGTNGKGSTCHMLAAILQESGMKTGLYTSPHITDFGERIRINGAMINEQFVIDFVERTKQVTLEIQPSFFELTVAMAFEYFAAEKVDIAIIETGMGGRLDSTNIITPVLSIITSIGYDHVDILGNTIEEIATEKAGIIKPNVPVVIGELLPESKNVFVDLANKNNSQIYFAEERYSIEYIDPEGQLLLCNIRNLDTNIVEKLRLDLTGVYQAKNARTVLCATDVLRKIIDIPERALHSGIEKVKKLTGIKGRWDIIKGNPTIIHDAAHNLDGLIQVMTQLQNDFSGSTYHFVLGFVKDKDVKPLLEFLPQSAKYYFTNAHIPRALPHTTLKTLAENAGLQGNSFDDVNDAIKAAKQNASKDDVIIICGSFFILAEIIIPAEVDSFPGN